MEFDIHIFNNLYRSLIINSKMISRFLLHKVSYASLLVQGSKFEWHKISITITNDLADKLREEYFSYLTCFTFICIYQAPRVFLMSAFFLLKYQDLQLVAKLST